MIIDDTRDLRERLKAERRQLGLTQEELALKAGVGLRFIRDIEQGKQSLRLDKVNQVLFLFGYRMAPVRIAGEKGIPS